MCILHVLCWLAVGTERWWICWYRRAFCSASHIILCADSAIRQCRATARGRVLCLYLQCHTHKHKLTWIRFILMAARVFAIDPNIQVVRRIALTIKKKGIDHRCLESILADRLLAAEAASASASDCHLQYCAFWCRFRSIRIRVWDESHREFGI